MRVTVFGSARSAPGDAVYASAKVLGQLLAEEGHVIVSGGYGGLMEAVSHGAMEAGGRVVGVTMQPWADRLKPNPYLGEEIAARTLYERLEALIESDALIALDGGAGTLAEVSLAWNLQQMALIATKPVILVGDAWRGLLDAFKANLVIDQRDLHFLIWVPRAEDVLPALHGANTDAGQWFG